MKKNIRIAFTLFTVFTICLFLLESCKKKEDTKAVITVQDTLGIPVGNATVILWQDTLIDPSTATPSEISNATVHISKQSGADGTAEFLFEPPDDLDQYLNVYASKGSAYGRAFVRVEEEKTASQSVVIR